MAVLNLKEVDVKRNHSFMDPYSAGLSYFFKEVAYLDRTQLRLLSEYADYPELRNLIEMKVDKNGDVLGFNVTDEPAYKQKKQQLKL